MTPTTPLVAFALVVAGALPAAAQTADPAEDGGALLSPPPLAAPVPAVPPFDPSPRRPRTYDLAPPSAIVGADGTYLGRYSRDRFAPDSVSNPYGRYGSRYSPDSIRNPYGRFGSRYSPESAANPYASNPPVLVDPYRGRLSANPYVPDSVSSPVSPFWRRWKDRGLELWQDLWSGW